MQLHRSMTQFAVLGPAYTALTPVTRCASVSSPPCRQAKLRHEIDGMKESMSSQSDEIMVAFEALVQLVSEEGRPTPSGPLLLDAVGLTSPSGKQITQGLLEKQESHEEDRPPTASPRSSTTSSAPSSTPSDDRESSILEAERGATARAIKNG